MQSLVGMHIIILGEQEDKVYYESMIKEYINVIGIAVKIR